MEIEIISRFGKITDLVSFLRTIVQISEGEGMLKQLSEVEEKEYKNSTESLNYLTSRTLNHIVKISIGNIKVSIEPANESHVIGITIDKITDEEEASLFADKLENSNAFENCLRGSMSLNNTELDYSLYKGERFLGNNILAREYKWSLTWIGVFPYEKLRLLRITTDGLKKMPVYKSKIVSSGSVYLRLVDSYNPADLSIEYVEQVEKLRSYLGSINS